MRNLWACQGRIAISIFLLLANLCVSSSATARVDREHDDFEGDGSGEIFGHVEQKEWQEESVPLPASPKESDLIPLLIYQRPKYKYYIDGASIKATEEDNVVRYTVVIETSSGLRNVFNEGIRCDTGTYKSYGFTIWGEPMKAVGHSDWLNITAGGATSYRIDLYNYYFCEKDVFRGNAKQMGELLKYPPDDYVTQQDE